jgi:hypothetical protein
MFKINVTIKGVASLLQHRFADEKQDEAPKKVSGKRDFSGESELALYRLSDGTIYQPSTHIEGAMVKSAAKYQIGGRGKKTYKDLFKSAIVIQPDCIPHKIQDYEVDRRAVIINRSRIMRERPIFKNWELDFEIIVMDEQIPMNVINQILTDAGQYIGIGDFRPKFGRFMITKFEEIK